MKHLLFIILLTLSGNVNAQENVFNSFPGYQPSHILDEKLSDISFALSFRILVSDYVGPLVRLRRSSDNAEQDFYHGDNDMVDVVAIDAWRAGSNVFMVKWYDQSGLGHDAVQSIQNQQPRFFGGLAKPYFKGDGSNDHLEVQVGFQSLTNFGVNGTVLAVLSATRRQQHAFGVMEGGNRWSAHINWSNNNIYFDPGVCCNNPRAYYNANSENVWNQYTFIRTDTRSIARLHGVQKFNGVYSKSSCTLNTYFSIGWATGTGNGGHSTTKYMEFVLYKTDIPAADYTEIEENAIIFWSL